MLALIGCSDPIDKAAKRRIFSAEDPPLAVAQAAEKLRPEDVADNPVVARRILRMSAAEATERLGPFTSTSTVTWEWSAPGRLIKLQEHRELVQGPGGVMGDFAASHDNSRDQGWKVLRVGGRVFAQSKYLPFRERTHDRGIAERVRNETFASLGDLDDLLGGRMALTAKGTVTLEGRTAWRYEASLGPERPPDDRAAPLPAPQFPRGGIDGTTARRLYFSEHRVPTSISGTVWVDAQSSVVLKAKVEGRLRVASDAGVAELKLGCETAMKNLGKEPRLSAPKEFLPDLDKPVGIAATLERYGFQRGAADGGTRLTPDEQRPDEDE